MRSKKGQFPGLPSFSFFRSFACRPPTTEAKKRFSSLLLVFLLLTVCMGLGRAGSLLPSPPSFSLSSLPITQLCPQRGGEQKMSLKMSGGHDNGRPTSLPRSEGERERTNPLISPQGGTKGKRRRRSPTSQTGPGLYSFCPKAKEFR